MTALDQIKQLELLAHDELSLRDIPFLLKAFKTMREIAMEFDRLSDDVFNERMK